MSCSGRVAGIVVREVKTDGATLGWNVPAWKLRKLRQIDLALSRRDNWVGRALEYLRCMPQALAAKRFIGTVNNSKLPHRSGARGNNSSGAGRTF